jgi:hypothetical protein
MTEYNSVEKLHRVAFIDKKRALSTENTIDMTKISSVQ